MAPCQPPSETRKISRSAVSAQESAPFWENHLPCTSYPSANFLLNQNLLKKPCNRDFIELKKPPQLFGSLCRPQKPFWISNLIWTLCCIIAGRRRTRYSHLPQELIPHSRTTKKDLAVHTNNMFSMSSSNHDVIASILDMFASSTGTVHKKTKAKSKTTHVAACHVYIYIYI